MEDKKAKLLIDLLNEYVEGKSMHFVDHNAALNGFEMLLDGKVEFLGDETVMCLRYGFIDWLFENGHIDMGKCMEDEDFKTLYNHYEAEDVAIMVLATRYSNYVLLLDWIK